MPVSLKVPVDKTRTNFVDRLTIGSSDRWSNRSTDHFSSSIHWFIVLKNLNINSLAAAAATAADYVNICVFNWNLCFHSAKQKQKRSKQIRQIGPIGDPKPDGAGLTVLLAHPRRRQRFGSQQTIQQFCSRTHITIIASLSLKTI